MKGLCYGKTKKNPAEIRERAERMAGIQNSAGVKSLFIVLTRLWCYIYQYPRIVLDIVEL